MQDAMTVIELGIQIMERARASDPHCAVQQAIMFRDGLMIVLLTPENRDSRIGSCARPCRAAIPTALPARSPPGLRPAGACRPTAPGMLPCSRWCVS
jgi:hypothetical protein